MLGLATLFAVVAAVTVGLSSAGASPRFVYTTSIADSGDLVVQIEEGALNRFSVVDYGLLGDATAMRPTSGILHENLTGSASLTPDQRGRVAGTLTLDIPTSPSETPCECGPLRIEYFNLRLLNLTNGRTYELDAVSREFP